MDLHSGNTSDREILPKMIHRIEDFKKNVKFNHNSLYVADSALYSRNFLLGSNSTDGVKWITRVPESIKVARNLLERPKEKEIWERHGDFEYTDIRINYEGVDQIWVLVFHKNSYWKEIGTLKRKLLKESTFLKKNLKNAERKIY
jgi:transposase